MARNRRSERSPHMSCQDFSQDAGHPYNCTRVDAQSTHYGGTKDPASLPTFLAANQNLGSSFRRTSLCSLPGQQTEEPRPVLHRDEVQLRVHRGILILLVWLRLKGEPNLRAPLSVALVIIRVLATSRRGNLNLDFRFDAKVAAVVYLSKLPRKRTQVELADVELSAAVELQAGVPIVSCIGDKICAG